MIVWTAKLKMQSWLMIASFLGFVSVVIGPNYMHTAVAQRLCPFDLLSPLVVAPVTAPKHLTEIRGRGGREAGQGVWRDSILCNTFRLLALSSCPTHTIARSCTSVSSIKRYT